MQITPIKQSAWTASCESSPTAPSRLARVTSSWVYPDAGGRRGGQRGTRPRATSASRMRASQASRGSRSVRTSTSGAGGGSYGSETREAGDLAGLGPAVEALDVALDHGLERRVHEDLCARRASSPRGCQRRRQLSLLATTDRPELRPRHGLYRQSRNLTVNTTTTHQCDFRCSSWTERVPSIVPRTSTG